MQSSDKGGKPALSRRAFVGKLAAGAAVASAVSITIGQAQALSRGAKVPTGAGNDDGHRDPMSHAPGAPEPGPVNAPAVGPSAVEVPAVSAASPPVIAPPPWELLRPLAVG